MSKRKIYTKTGDDGTTSLIGGERVQKDDAQVAAYGEVDELNAWLGICRALATEKRRLDLVQKLEQIQSILFEIGSILATKESWSGMPEIKEHDVAQLETWIDLLEESLPELKNFILPGSDLLSAHLHVARATCRRAERAIIGLSHLYLGRGEKIADNIVTYINRLSDLLFTMARFEAQSAGGNDLIWTSRKLSA